MAQLTGSALIAGIVGLIFSILLCCIPAILFYYFWSTIPSVGTAVDTAFGGKQDPNFCKDNKCITNCVLWNDIEKNNADYYCAKDLGPGWKSTGNWSQADCIVGQGKTSCVQDPTRKDYKYWNNCVPWEQIETNANAFCSNDFGKGWIYAGIRDQGGCPWGQGKAMCKYSPVVATQERMKNCAYWDQIPDNGNFWCYTDFGDGWAYTGDRDRAGCTDILQGKGMCAKDPSRAGLKYQNNCAAWTSIEAGGDQWCVNDFGPGWKYVGREQAGCAKGSGRGMCKPG